MRIARGAEKPCAQATPARGVWAATQLHTARLLGALDKDAARRQPAPIGPEMAPAASVTRWESRCRGFHPLAPAPRQSARVRSPSRRAARRRRGPRGPKLDCPRWGPTQRPLVRAAAPAAPAPVSGTNWKPARFFREAGAQRTLEPACGRVRAKVCSELPLPQRSLNVGGAVGTTGRDHRAGPDDGTRRRDQASGPDACGSQKRAPKTARLASVSPAHNLDKSWGFFDLDCDGD